LAQLVGVPTVSSCWNLLQRNANYACISSTIRTFFYRLSASRRVVKSLQQTDWRSSPPSSSIYLVKQSWRKIGNLTIHTSRCLTVLRLLPADFLCLK